MKPFAKKLLPVALTLAVVAAALIVFVHLWRYYIEAPWTRDAHVSADVIQIAPDVSGLVTEVKVRDNAGVKRGDVLFVVDQSHYQIALEQARATLEQARAARAQGDALLEQGRAALAQSLAAQHELERETARDAELKDLVAAEEIEARHTNLEKAQAGVAAANASIAAANAAIAASGAATAAANAAIDQARLNLDRTLVRSPVDGRVNDRTVRVGDYVTAGRPVLAVLDTSSFRVDGYFEETRLHGIAPGQPVEIRLMGEDTVLHGHVQSIAAGIEDRYRSDGASLLPNVTPAFDWVRLAQRVPVRISIDAVPPGVRLIAGRSATVSIVPSPAGNPAAARP